MISDQISRFTVFAFDNSKELPVFLNRCQEPKLIREIFKLFVTTYFIRGSGDKLGFVTSRNGDAEICVDYCNDSIDALKRMRPFFEEGAPGGSPNLNRTLLSCIDVFNDIPPEYKREIFLLWFSTQSGSSISELKKTITVLQTMKVSVSIVTFEREPNSLQLLSSDTRGSWTVARDNDHFRSIIEKYASGKPAKVVKSLSDWYGEPGNTAPSHERAEELSTTEKVLNDNVQDQQKPANTAEADDNSLLFNAMRFLAPGNSTEKVLNDNVQDQQKPENTAERDEKPLIYYAKRLEQLQDDYSQILEKRNTIRYFHHIMKSTSLPAAVNAARAIQQQKQKTLNGISNIRNGGVDHEGRRGEINPIQQLNAGIPPSGNLIPGDGAKNPYFSFPNRGSNLVQVLGELPGMKDSSLDSDGVKLALERMRNTGALMDGTGKPLPPNPDLVMMKKGCDLSFDQIRSQVRNLKVRHTNFFTRIQAEIEDEEDVKLKAMGVDERVATLVAEQKSLLREQARMIAELKADTKTMEETRHDVALKAREAYFAKVSDRTATIKDRELYEEMQRKVSELKDPKQRLMLKRNIARSNHARDGIGGSASPMKAFNLKVEDGDGDVELETLLRGYNIPPVEIDRGPHMLPKSSVLKGARSLGGMQELRDKWEKRGSPNFAEMVRRTKEQERLRAQKYGDINSGPAGLASAKWEATVENEELRGKLERQKRLKDEEGWFNPVQQVVRNVIGGATGADIEESPVGKDLAIVSFIDDGEVLQPDGILDIDIVKLVHALYLPSPALNHNDEGIPLIRKDSLIQGTCAFSGDIMTLLKTPSRECVYQVDEAYEVVRACVAQKRLALSSEGAQKLLELATACREEHVRGHPRSSLFLPLLAESLKFFPHSPTLIRAISEAIANLFEGSQQQSRIASSLIPGILVGMTSHESSARSNASMALAAVVNSPGSASLPPVGIALMLSISEVTKRGLTADSCLYVLTNSQSTLLLKFQVALVLKILGDWKLGNGTVLPRALLLMHALAERAELQWRSGIEPPSKRKSKRGNTSKPTTTNAISSSSGESNESTGGIKMNEIFKAPSFPPISLPKLEMPSIEMPKLPSLSNISIQSPVNALTDMLGGVLGGGWFGGSAGSSSPPPNVPAQIRSAPMRVESKQNTGNGKGVSLNRRKLSPAKVQEKTDIYKEEDSMETSNNVMLNKMISTPSALQVKASSSNVSDSFIPSGGIRHASSSKVGLNSEMNSNNGWISGFSDAIASAARRKSNLANDTFAFYPDDILSHSAGAADIVGDEFAELEPPIEILWSRAEEKGNATGFDAMPASGPDWLGNNFKEIDIVVNAMNTNAVDRHIQGAGSLAIAALCRVSRDHAYTITVRNKGAALQAVIDATKSRLDSAAAMRGLAELLDAIGGVASVLMKHEAGSYFSNGDVQRGKDMLAQLPSDALGVLFDGLIFHSGDVQVIAPVLSAISLWRGDALIAASKILTASLFKNLVDAAVSCMEVEDVAAAANRCLMRFADDDHLRRQLSETGATVIPATLLRTRARDSRAVASAARCLTLLVYKEDDALDHLRRTQAIEALSDALVMIDSKEEQLNGSDVRAVQCILECLCNCCVARPEYSLIFMESNGCIRAIRTVERSLQMCIGGDKLLSPLGMELLAQACRLCAVLDILSPQELDSNSLESREAYSGRIESLVEEFIVVGESRTRLMALMMGRAGIYQHVRRLMGNDGDISIYAASSARSFK